MSQPDPPQLRVRLPVSVPESDVRLTAQVSVGQLRNITDLEDVAVRPSHGDIEGTNTVRTTIRVVPELHVGCVVEVRHTGDTGVRLRPEPSTRDQNQDKRDDAREGARLTIVAGPSPSIPLEAKPYRWWWVRDSLGREGWAAEGEPFVQHWLWPVP